jgi:hypothetical protein
MSKAWTRSAQRRILNNQAASASAGALFYNKNYNYNNPKKNGKFNSITRQLDTGQPIRNYSKNKNCEVAPDNMEVELRKYEEYIDPKTIQKLKAKYKKNQTQRNYDEVLREAYTTAFNKYAEISNQAYKDLISNTLNTFMTNFSNIAIQPPCPLIPTTKNTGMVKSLVFKYAGEILTPKFMRRGK